MEDPGTKFNFLVVLNCLVKSLPLALGSTQTVRLLVFFGLTAWPWGSVVGPWGARLVCPFSPLGVPIPQPLTFLLQDFCVI